jgi:hypothetical protein
LCINRSTAYDASYEETRNDTDLSRNERKAEIPKINASEIKYLWRISEEGIVSREKHQM